MTTRRRRSPPSFQRAANPPCPASHPRRTTPTTPGRPRPVRREEGEDAGPDDAGPTTPDRTTPGRTTPGRTTTVTTAAAEPAPGREPELSPAPAGRHYGGQLCPPETARSPCASSPPPPTPAYSGNVSGGNVLEWIDKAGYACAVGWSGRYCVTAYVGDVRFTTPVRVGHLVEATGRLLHTGRSSMQVLVTVRSGDPTDRVLQHATACLMVFVAVDEDGQGGAGAALAADRRARRAAAGRRDAADQGAGRYRGRDGQPDLHRRRHRAPDLPALPGRARPTSTGAARCTAAR